MCLLVGPSPDCATPVPDGVDRLLDRLDQRGVGGPAQVEPDDFGGESGMQLAYIGSWRHTLCAGSVWPGEMTKRAPLLWTMLDERRRLAAQMSCASGQRFGNGSRWEDRARWAAQPCRKVTLANALDGNIGDSARPK